MITNLHEDLRFKLYWIWLLVNRGEFFGHCEISKRPVDSSTGDHTELRPRAGAPLPASPQLVSVSDDGTDQFVSTSK